MEASRDDWAELLRLARSFGLKRYGMAPAAISLHFPGLGEHREPVPPQFLAPAREKVKRPAWVRGDGPEHLTDFQQVWWPALGLFKFTPKQAIVVKLLWEAMEDGTDSVGQEILLRACDSDCTRLRDLFSRNPAWGSLILPSGGGTYRLLPLDEDEDDEGG